MAATEKVIVLGSANKGEPNTSASQKILWTGRVISAVPVLFLLVDGVMKLFKPEIVVKSTVELGYSESVIIPLGIILFGVSTHQRKASTLK